MRGSAVKVAFLMLKVALKQGAPRGVCGIILRSSILHAG